MKLVRKESLATSMSQLSFISAFDTLSRISLNVPLFLSIRAFFFELLLGLGDIIVPCLARNV